MNSINDNYLTKIVSFQTGIRTITNNSITSSAVRGQLLPMGDSKNYC